MYLDTIALDFRGFVGRMSRFPQGSVGRTALLHALIAVGPILVAPCSPASAAVPADAKAATPAKLTLESAKPMAVPPPPAISIPRTPKAPPRFVTPQVMDAPPVPELTVGPASVQPRPAPQPAPPQAPAQAAAPARQTPAAPATTAPAPGRTETAALPPPPPATTAPAAPVSRPLTVLFTESAASLPDDVDPTVDEIVRRLKASDTARLQLRSYAAGTPETAREARQLSLARALGLRERLTAFGIRSTRIDIRALGIDAGGGSPDRIDVEFLNE